jgi:hypothetical protein
MNDDRPESFPQSNPTPNPQATGLRSTLHPLQPRESIDWTPSSEVHSHPQSPLPPSLNLHIEQLTLHGFSTLDRDRIGAVIQSELARLFAEQGIPRSVMQSGAIHQLDGSTFEMAAGTPPRIIGAQIAQAIYQGLSHE